MGTVFFYTLRESLSRRMGLVMLVISVLVPLGLLYSLSIEKTAAGTYLVGTVHKVPAETSFKMVSNALVGMAQSLWILVAIFVAGPLLCSYLEKGWADMLLTKGVARWKFLVGRVLGCVFLYGLMLLLVNGLPALYFWVRTGVPVQSFLLSTGLLLFNFLCLVSLMVLVSVALPNPALLILTAFLQMGFSSVLVSRKEIVEFLGKPWLGPPLEFAYTILPRTKEVNNLSLNILAGQAVTSWSPFWWSAALAVVFTAIACVTLHRKNF